MPPRAFLTSRRWLITLAGTAGCWFLLDYAYYGNTISTPQILGLISPHASTTTKIALQLAIFAVAAVPGYVLAIAWLDRIGHRRLQDRKSTRLNSSHANISYAVFCLKKKKHKNK